MIESDPERSSPGITILELNPVAGIFDEDGEYVWYYSSGSFTGAAQRTPAGGVAFQHDPSAFSVNDITSRRIAEYYPDPTGADETAENADGVATIPFHAAGSSCILCTMTSSR